MSISDTPNGRRSDHATEEEGFHDPHSQSPHSQDPRLTNPQQGQQVDPRLAQQQFAQDGQPIQQGALHGAQGQAQAGYGQGGQYQTPQQQNYQGQQPAYGQQQAPANAQAFQGAPQGQGQFGGQQPVQGAPAGYGQQAGVDQAAIANSQLHQSQQGYQHPTGNTQDMLDEQRVQMYAAQAAGHDGLQEQEYAQAQAQQGYNNVNFDHAQGGVAPQGSYDTFRSAAEQVVEAGYGTNADGMQFAHADPSESVFASTGIQSDASFYESEYDEDEYDDETGGRKKMLLVGVLVGALGLGGALAYAYKFGPLGGKTKLAGDPPLITAETDPAKETPAVAGGREFPNRGKMFYDRLTSEASGGAAGDTPERIVSRQEPVIESTNAVGNLPAKPKTAGGVTGPKRVQTLKVLPNGRIVSDAQVAAPATAAATVKPVVKAAPAPKTAVAVTSQTQGRQSALATPQVGASVPQVAPAASSQPARRVVIPAAQPQTTAALPTSGFVVQLAARRSEADARAAFVKLQSKYPTLLNSYDPIIQKADLGAKGIFYRLRVGPLTTKDSAGSLCQKLKAKGEGCLVKQL